MTPTIVTVVVLFFLVLLARRMFHKNRQDLETYLRSHGQKAERSISAMKSETSRFDAGEALAPVEAGLRELIELHGSPDHICLNRRGDALVIDCGQEHVEVYWNLRSTTLTHKGRTRYIYGNGQWELSINNALTEPYPRLDTLMGRLSQLVRQMTGKGREQAFHRPGIPAYRPSSSR